MVHVLPGGHPSRVSAVEGHGDSPDLAGEKRVTAIQFPAVNAPIHDLLLEALPPSHGVGVAVINKAALALPPAPLEAVARQVSLGTSFLVELRRVGDPRILAVTVNHAGHPENDAVTLTLQAMEVPLRLRIADLIHLEIVVAVAPRAINQDGAHGQIVFGVTFQQLSYPSGRIDVVFP